MLCYACIAGFTRTITIATTQADSVIYRASRKPSPALRRARSPCTCVRARYSPSGLVRSGKKKNLLKSLPKNSRFFSFLFLNLLPPRLGIGVCIRQRRLRHLFVSAGCSTLVFFSSLCGVCLVLCKYLLASGMAVFHSMELIQQGESMPRPVYRFNRHPALVSS